MKTELFYCTLHWPILFLDFGFILVQKTWLNEDSIGPISSRDCQSRRTAAQRANVYTIYSRVPWFLILMEQPIFNSMAILLLEAVGYKVDEIAMQIFSFIPNHTESRYFISCLLTDVSLFTPCPCLWVNSLISNRIHQGLPNFSCLSLIHDLFSHRSLQCSSREAM